MSSAICAHRRPETATRSPPLRRECRFAREQAPTARPGPGRQQQPNRYGPRRSRSRRTLRVRRSPNHVTWWHTPAWRPQWDGKWRGRPESLVVVGHSSRSETAETTIGRLITQRSQVQILPRCYRKIVRIRTDLRLLRVCSRSDDTTT